MEQLVTLSPALGVVGLVIAYLIYLHIVKQPVGTEKMKEIADMIHDGSMVYLKRQYSIIAIFIGVFFELLLAFKRTNEQGHEVSRFWMVPIPAALGFALILPGSLNIGIAIGSVISAAWRQFSPGESGVYAHYAAPLASGLVAGEAMVGSIMMPALAVLMQFFN